MIVELPCYRIDCNGCGEPLENEDGARYYLKPDDADDELDCAEWKQLARVHLCPRCAVKPHAFELKPNTTDECWRCDEPADEHQAVDPYPPIAVADGQLDIAAVVRL